MCHQDPVRDHHHRPFKDPDCTWAFPKVDHNHIHCNLRDQLMLVDWDYIHRGLLLFQPLPRILFEIDAYRLIY